jgi:cell division protein FtsQ
MPLSDNYTYYTTVVTNAPDMHSDSAGMVLKAKIVKMVRSLQADKFWNAQVSQVIIDSVGTFEFVPVLGNQRIRFGDTINTAEKLANLVVFYKNVLNRIGWDKYEVLDVRFNNQVVASPSLPYAGPKDMAVKKMNWISSIEMTEAQKLREDSMRRQQQIVEKANASVLKKVSKVVPVAAAPEPKQKTDLKNTAKSEVKKVETKKTIAKPAVSKPNIKTPSPKSDAAKSTAAKDKPKAKEEAKPAKADVKAKPPVAKPDSKNKENKKDKNKEDKNKAKPKDKPKTNKKADTKKEETKKTKDKKSEKKPEKEKTTDKKAAAAKYTYPQ